MADQFVARRWLIDLGRLTAIRSNPDDAVDFVEAMAPMLAMRFPDEAFTAASLEAVAAECKYLPTYGELVGYLHAWWRDHRPRPRALPSPPIRQRDEPTHEEREHVTRVTAETLAALQSSAQPIGDRRPVACYLSRKQLVEAYQRAGVRAPQVREETA
jgi:hypothetical protein